MDIHHFAPRFRLTWIKRSTRMRLGMARWKWSGIFNPIVPLSSVIDMMPSSQVLMWETLFLCKKLTRHRSFSSIHSSIWLVCCPYCSSNLVGIFLHILELLFQNPNFQFIRSGNLSLFSLFTEHPLKPWRAGKLNIFNPHFKEEFGNFLGNCCM